MVSKSPAYHSAHPAEYVAREPVRQERDLDRKGDLSLGVSALCPIVLQRHGDC